MTDRSVQGTRMDGPLYKHVHSTLHIEDDVLDIKALYQNDFDAYDYVKQFLGPTKAALSSQSDGKSGTHTTNLSHGTSAKSFDSNLRIAISRMNISITEVDQRIQDLVTQHAGDFLERIDQVDTLQESLSVTRKNMAALHQQASDAREHVHRPLSTIQTQQARLEQLQGLDEIIVRSKQVMETISRIFQHKDAVLNFDVMASIQDLDSLHTYASQTVVLCTLLGDLDLLVHTTSTTDEDEAKLCSEVVQLDCIRSSYEKIPGIREELFEKVENLLLCGLRNMSPSLLGLSLQAAHNMKMLSTVIEKLLEDLADVLMGRIEASLDLIAIGRELHERQPPVLPDSYRATKYQIRESSKSDTLKHFTNWVEAVWRRIQILVDDEFPAIYSKVHTLEQVLYLKLIPQSSEKLITAVQMKLGHRPTHILVNSFVQHLNTALNERISESEFWHYICVTCYPKLAEIFYDLLSRLSFNKDESDPLRTGDIAKILEHRDKEYRLEIFTLWEKISQAICENIVDSAKGSQCVDDINRLFKSIRGELSACASIPTLFEKTFVITEQVLDSLLTQLTKLISHEESAFSLTNTRPTYQQQVNANVADTLNAFYESVSKLNQFEETRVQEKVRTWRTNVSEVVVSKLVSPLASSVKSEMRTVLARIHRFKIDKPLNMETNGPSTDPSAYMLEFTARLAFLQKNLLHHISFVQDTLLYVQDLASFALIIFVLHATLIRLTKDQDKLQLVADMTALELSLTQLLATAARTANIKPVSLTSCGVSFQSIRALRGLLFEPIKVFENPAASMKDWEMPKILHIQLLLSRSETLPLPNDIRKMSKASYVDWVVSTSQSKKVYISDDVERAIVNGLREWLEKEKSTPTSESMDHLVQEYLLNWLRT